MTTGSGAVTSCTSCGAAIEPGFRFCGGCGAPVPAPPAATERDLATLDGRTTIVDDMSALVAKARSSKTAESPQLPRLADLPPPVPGSSSPAPPDPPPAAPESTPVLLVVTSGARTGTRVPVDADLVIGRGVTDALCFDEDQRVSRQHARIRLESDAAPTIEDLDSGNGTFVNGERIASERLLENGDVVVIGTTVLEVSVTSPVPDAQTTAQTVVGTRRVATIDYDGNVTTLGDAEELLIGREPQCDLVVGSHEASRQHARIVQIDGRWALADLGSMNGTYLNGERLNNESRWLTPGDSFTIGGEKLTFDEAVLPV